MSTTLAPAEVEVEQPQQEEWREIDRPWIVIVWNDPINLMSYVTFVFQKLFGYSREKATQLMLRCTTRARRSSRPGRARRPSTTSRACTRTGCGRR